MKYALFEFKDEDGALYIGETSLIVDLDDDMKNNESYDFDAGEVEVLWKGGKKICNANVVHFSGM